MNDLIICFMFYILYFVFLFYLMFLLLLMNFVDWGTNVVGRVIKGP